MFDKDEQEISQIIGVGLEKILSGESTLEEILAAFPEQGDMIRSELEASLWLVTRQAQVSARPGFVSNSRNRVVARIKEEAANQGAKRGLLGIIWPHRVIYRWAASLSLIFALLFSGVTGVIGLSQSTLPGDDLYQVKRAYEQVTISVQPNDAQRANLIAEFSKRRLNEAQLLIDRGDYRAAEMSLGEYSLGIKQSLVILQGMSDAQLGLKQNLALSFQQNLSKNSEQLDRLMSSVPVDIKGAVYQARQTSVSGVTTASNVIKEVNDKQTATMTATNIPPTATPKSTSRSASTATPVPSVIVPVLPPVKTAVPTSVPVLPTATAVPPTATLLPTATETPTAIPTATDTPVIPTETPSPMPVDTSTPVPSPTETPTNIPIPNTPTTPPLPTDTVVPIAPPATDTPVAGIPPANLPSDTPAAVVFPTGGITLTPPPPDPTPGHPLQ